MDKNFWVDKASIFVFIVSFLGAPLVIQRTCAERNRAAAASATVGGALGFGLNSKVVVGVLFLSIKSF